ncbi:MAG: sensor histidine kinase [Alphaproteobacteria bacterium]
MLLGKTLRSSTLRLAFIYIAVCGAAILGLFGFVYWATLSYVEARQANDIARERDLLASGFARGGRAGLVEAIDRRLSGRKFDGWVYLLADASLTPVAGNLSRWPAQLSDDPGGAVFAPPEYPGETVRAEFKDLPDGSRLLVGQIDDRTGFVRAVGSGLAIAVAMILVLATAAGISTSRRSVTRIEAINAISREIMATGPGRRVPRRGTGDEWDELADNLNAMLDRIEELIETNRQVSNNIAHDLRTPLTRLRGRLESAWRQPFDAALYKSVLGETIAELDGVLRIFSSLLRISQIEAHRRRAGFREIDLSALAREVVELFEPVAEEKGVSIALRDPGPVTIGGDRDLLFDAVSNLIDNALEHGNGDVSVAVGETDSAIAISVADRGPGIPADERENVLRRFYRLERSRHSTGSGLGLSLVAAVAQLHGASIQMTDNAPGLKVELRFPLSEGSAR